MTQHIGAPVTPIGGQASQIVSAKRVGREKLDRQGMPIERTQQPRQGGVGGEMLAGVAEEQSARVGVVKPLDVLAASTRRGQGVWAARRAP